MVDKYHIPTVKVTGGQRIDLLGVKKEDLVNVWKDIGMPSGHAYAKALRTVKTCVGSEWCRMGTQDSTQMGKDLERAMWRMNAPHKVKFAVSGCPRNCAEAGIKDVGVIGVAVFRERYVPPPPPVWPHPSRRPEADTADRPPVRPPRRAHGFHS